jgi:hypothetical protein
MSYGPFSEGCSAGERPAQLRWLQGILACHVGSGHPVISVLRSAEGDAAALGTARKTFEQLPALTRRRVLAMFSSVTWPNTGTVKKYHGSGASPDGKSS